MTDQTRQATEAKRRLLADCEAFIDEWERRRAEKGLKVERPADAYFGFRAARNPEFLENLRGPGFPKPQTVDKVTKFMSDWRAAWKAGRDPEDDEKQARARARKRSAGRKRSK